MTNKQSHDDGTLSETEYQWLVARGRGGVRGGEHLRPGGRSAHGDAGRPTEPTPYGAPSSDACGPRGSAVRRIPLGSARGASDVGSSGAGAHELSDVFDGLMGLGQE